MGWIFSLSAQHHHRSQLLFLTRRFGLFVALPVLDDEVESWEIVVDVVGMNMASFIDLCLLSEMKSSIDLKRRKDGAPPAIEIPGPSSFLVGVYNLILPSIVFYRRLDN